MERWKEVYSFRVNPINGRTLWTRVNAPTTITPPKHHTQVGRPKKLRKRSAVELEEMTQSGRLSKKHTKGACSKCKKTGHNSRTCKGQGEAVKTGKSGKSGNAGKKRKVAAK
ncbi:putative transcription factor interactor and regulator CCHC(Zn) family [Helianthus debilis subsp. tardiflorus]